ncbi:hypothetical protein M758_1G098500 [Ceratodon purpureus]|nr:hypothetical protein M758_1G098500 [Ceratodon purpureus]
MPTTSASFRQRLAPENCCQEGCPIVSLQMQSIDVPADANIDSEDIHRSLASREQTPGDERHQKRRRQLKAYNPRKLPRQTLAKVARNGWHRRKNSRAYIDKRNQSSWFVLPQPHQRPQRGKRHSKHQIRIRLQSLQQILPRELQPLGTNPERRQPMQNRISERPAQPHRLKLMVLGDAPMRNLRQCVVQSRDVQKPNQPLENLLRKIKAVVLADLQESGEADELDERGDNVDDRGLDAGRECIILGERGSFVVDGMRAECERRTVEEVEERHLSDEVSAAPWLWRKRDAKLCNSFHHLRKLQTLKEVHTTEALALSTPIFT